MNRGRAIGLAVLLAAGCGSERTAEKAPADSPAPRAGISEHAAPGAAWALPASFAGDLPCADCAGLHYQLLVRPDGVYFLRRTYRAPDASVAVRSFDEIGRWTLQDSTLVLRGGREAPDLFRVQGASHLRKLDLQGKDIESKLNYDLEREPSPAALEPQLRMSGSIMGSGAGALFVECLTGLRLGVAPEADAAALAQAVARVPSGAASLAFIEGRIVQREPATPGPVQEMLVVTKFERVVPGESCAPSATAEGVADRDWYLVAAGETPVPAGMRRAPFLRFDPAAGTVHGFAGCNTFQGPFKMEGGALTLGPLAATLMACLEGGATESAFLGALNATAGWQLRDGHLELLDTSGKTLARFALQPGAP